MNKRSIILVRLGDQPLSILICEDDTTDPPDFKFCAEGGVYDVYDFVDLGLNLGSVLYPYGARRLPRRFVDPASL